MREKQFCVGFRLISENGDHLVISHQKMFKYTAWSFDSNNMDSNSVVKVRGAQGGGAESPPYFLAPYLNVYPVHIKPVDCAK